MGNIVKNIDNTYLVNEDKYVDIILYSEGNISKKYVKNTVEKAFSEENIVFNTYVIDKVTSKDKALARKYKVSPAKIAYINNNVKDKNIDIKSFINKPVSDLFSFKESGYYCDEDRVLDGNRCRKEKERIKATYGDTCPEGYYEYNGICYERGRDIETGNIICNDEFTLEGKNCIRKQTYGAIAKCGDDEYDGGLNKCVKKKYIGEAEQYCRITPGEDLLYNGRCLGRKPTINGGCLGNDVVIAGWCYDTSANSGYEADWTCNMHSADGELILLGKDEEHKCYERTYYDVPSYYCNEEEAKIVDNKCIMEHIERPFNEITCEDGYTLINKNTCINMNKTTNKEKGYICDYPDSGLFGDTCILYDSIDAKISN